MDELQASRGGQATPFAKARKLSVCFSVSSFFAISIALAWLGKLPIISSNQIVVVEEVIVDYMLSGCFT